MTRPAAWSQLGLLLTLLTLVGCSATGPAPARFEERKALPAPTEPREIALTRLVSKLPVGTRIGRTSEGWLCLPQGPMTWRVGVDEDVPGEVIGILRDELQKAGYRTPGPPKSLFDEAKEGQAELLLAGAIKAVTLNVCSGPHLDDRRNGEVESWRPRRLLRRGGGGPQEPARPGGLRQGRRQHGPRAATV